MQKGYGQFCPVAKAAEIIGEKWNLIILRELICGNYTFNELRHGMPKMSPTLLSRRLKELEAEKIIRKVPTPGSRSRHRYDLTPAGQAFAPIIEQIGKWGTEHATSRLDKADYDPALLMWDMKRRIRLDFFDSKSRFVVSFQFTGVPRHQANWWLIVHKDEADVCLKDPGFEPDLWVESSIRTMVPVWMGKEKLRTAIRSGAITLTGKVRDVRDFPKWFGLSLFAPA